MRRKTAAFLAVLGVLAAAAALVDTASGRPVGSAKAWKPHVDQTAGFRIDIPANWQVIPRSVAALKDRIRTLRAEGRIALADQYKALLDDPYQRQQLRTFRFSAFQWPALPSPITSDVYVKIAAVPASVQTSDLPAIARVIADELKGPGSHVGPVRRIRLPAGAGVLLTGSAKLDPSYRAKATGFRLYLFLRPRRLFQLGFRTDSAFAASQRVLFISIASRFGFLR